MRSSTLGSGNAQDISISTGDLTIDGGGIDGFTGITSQTETGSTGRAGNVLIVAEAIDLRNEGDIASSTFGEGDAGTVDIVAKDVFLDGGDPVGFSGIASAANIGSSGSGGSVVLRAEKLTIRNGARISSSTFGPGDAGQIAIQVDDILIDGDGASQPTGVTSEAEIQSSGNAGFLTINADDLTIRSGGVVSTFTLGQGDGGDVDLTVDRLSIDGGNQPVLTGIFSVAGRTSEGDAGNIEIVADQIDVVKAGQITSGTASSGDAGNVDLTADRVTLDGQGARGLTGITSQANSVSTGGNGGQIVVKVGALEIRNGAEMTSITFSDGDAGGIRIDADSITIAGVPKNRTRLITGISSQADAGSSGDANDVTVNTGTLKIEQGGQIASSTFGLGDAGNVNVTADAIEIVGEGVRTPFFTGIGSQAESISVGDAGDIVLNVRVLSLRDGGLITTGTASSGQGGDISIVADEIDIRGVASDPIRTPTESPAARLLGQQAREATFP